MEKIWWNRVPNAQRFISDVVEHLLNEKSIVLKSSADIPWYSYLEENIRETVKQQNSSKRFERLCGIGNPGNYLLSEYCKQEKRASYRPSKTYARFLAESDDIVLHERYLWVQIDSKDQLNAWLEFIAEYLKEREKNKEVAVFILNWINQNNDIVQLRKGITICSLDDYVNEYDRKVFCTLAASSVNEKPYMKSYLTELAANIMGNDIELCASCLENYREFLSDPFNAIKTVIETKSRNDGTRFTFDKTKEATDHLIWLAQIKAIYPILEEYREIFVQRHYNLIAKSLPMSSPSGEVYVDPKDVELGTLKYMSDNGNLPLDQKEYDQLKLFKEARNCLSHLSVLKMEEIKKLVI